MWRYWLLISVIFSNYEQYPCASSGSVEQSLLKIFSLRVPHPFYFPNSLTKCHIVFFHSFSHVINFQFLHQEFYTQEIRLNAAARRSSVQHFRLSPPCLHILLDAKEREKFHKKWIQENILNLAQPNVHFLFLSTDKTPLQNLLITPGANSIKYKTAFCITTNQVLIKDTLLQHLLMSDFSNQEGNPPLPPFPKEVQLVQGQKVHVAFWNFAPYTSQDRRGVPVGGFTYSPAIAIARAFNFTLTYEITSKPLSQLPNGSWTGFMHDMIDGDGDGCFGLGAIISRIPYIDFTTWSLYFYLKFFTTHPEVNIKWQAILFPFDHTAWAAIGLAFLGSMPLFYVQLKVTAGRSWEGRTAKFLSVFVPYGIFLGQVWIIPKHAKFLTLLFIFFALIITTCYNSNLISFLTFPETDPVPQTFHELAEARHNYHIVHWYVPGHLPGVHLSTSKNADIVKIWQQTTRLEHQVDCPLKAATMPRTACIIFTINAGLYVAKNLTIRSTWNPLLESKEATLSIPVTMGMRKKSRFYDLFNTYIGVLRDNGLVEHWRADAVEYERINSLPWMKDQMRRNTPLAVNLTRAMENAVVGELKPFTLKNFILCFVALVTGLFLALMAMILEVMNKKSTIAQKNQKTIYRK